MKKVFLLTILFLLSCKAQVEQTPVETTAVDSVLEKSQKDLDSAIVISSKSDSATKKTIVKVIKEIKYLNQIVDRYKQVQALTTQTVATEKIIYRIDTVYIETKKNFWGKEKTNTTVKSDSVVEVSSDSVTKVKIDTLNHN